MKPKSPRVIVGAGVLGFVVVTAAWLATSGDSAVADPERRVAVTQSVEQEVASPVPLAGRTESQLTFAEAEGVLHQLSVHLEVQTDDARSMKVYLTSPSGMKVLVVDGARSTALKSGGLEGWFGADGLQTAESLAAFTGEPVTGAWSLTVNSKAAGKLAKWSLTTDVGSNTSLAGLETYGEYDGGGGGCDCRVVGGTEIAGGLMASLLLLGLVFVRRRS